MTVPFFHSLFNSIAQLMIAFFKKAKPKNNNNKNPRIVSEKKKFTRAEWVIYLNVRSIGIKIAFYRMSSPVLFMP